MANKPLLKACPGSPNCVSSLALRASQKVEPFAAPGGAAAALKKLRRIIESMPRAKIVDTRDGYLRAEFTSGMFRFVDDLELAVDEAAKTVHVRSASRVGYSDFGVNRKRVESIRAQYGK